MYEGKCQSCDEYGEVDGNSLCRDCGAKLERDMIRTRQWSYSVMAWAMKDEAREEMRDKVITEYGKDTELIDA